MNNMYGDQSLIECKICGGYAKSLTEEESLDGSNLVASIQNVDLSVDAQRFVPVCKMSEVVAELLDEDESCGGLPFIFETEGDNPSVAVSSLAGPSENDTDLPNPAITGIESVNLLQGHQADTPYIPPVSAISTLSNRVRSLDFSSMYASLGTIWGNRMGGVFPPPVISPIKYESEYLTDDDLVAFGPFETEDRNTSDQETPPIREREWRREFAHPLAEEYCNIAAQDFSAQALEAAVEKSTLLMKEVGSYWMTSRHIQEVQMRMKEGAREYLGSHRHLFPAIAHEVGDIFRIGVAPFRESGCSHPGKGTPS